MKKLRLNIFLICNVVVLVVVVLLVQRGIFDENKEIEYISEGNVEETYELSGNDEITFRFVNFLNNIDNLLLKFSGCQNHQEGQLSVKIYDDEAEYYVYEVPVYAFTDDFFYLYTNALPGLQDNRNYYVTIAVEGLEEGKIVFHGTEETYFNTIGGDISPFWGVSGSDARVSEALGRVYLVWAGLDIAYIIVVLFLTRERIKSLQKYVYIQLGLFIGLSAVVGVVVYHYADSVIEEQTYAYWTHNNVSEFINIPIKEGEVLQSFTAGFDSLEQFVLFFDNYTNEDQAAIGVQLEDDKGNVYYSWYVDVAVLPSETFCLVAHVENELSKGREYYLRIYLDSPQSDITVRAVSEEDMHESVGVLTVAGENREETKLYFYQGYQVLFSYVRIWSYILAATFVAFLFVVFSSKEICLKIWDLVSVLLLVFVSYYSIESLSGNLNSVPIKYAAVNCFLILCLYLILRSLFLRKAYYIVAVMTLIAGLANFYVLQFRGSQLLFTDIKSFSTAMSVVGNYEFTVPPIVFMSILLFICLIFIQSAVDIKCNNIYQKVKLPGRAMLMASGIVLIVAININMANEEFKFFSLNSSFAKFGWCYSNLFVSKLSSVQKPLNYSDKRVESILAEIEEIDNEGYTKPQNLIVIMNESFSDLQVTGELETNQDYMPYIRSLSENTVKGNLHVSTFGGNTCITEYEFLTGNSQHLMPMGSMPYTDTGIYEAEEAGMVRTLQAQGYYAVAMHPFGSTNWNRDEVYPAMGFDEFLSEDDYEDAEKIRNYVSDKSDYQKIIEYCENFDRGEKLFIFNVTMQNHGGFDVNNGTLDKSITIENFESEVGETYLSLINESDKAFEYLLSYFSEVEEPTMIVMFGDHLPYLPNSFYELLYGKEMDERNAWEESLQYITPYIIWTNYDSDFEQIADTSVNYLGRLVMQYAGLELSDYDKFLLQLRKEIPVVGMNGIYDKDGRFTIYEDVPQGALSDYQMLQYLRLEDRESKFYNIFSVE